MTRHTSAVSGEAALRTNQFVTLASGIKLHYASAGNPHAPLVVMLHGFPEFWRAWADVMPGLAHRWHVLAPDMRGYNLSDKPAEVRAYGHKALTADVVELIDRFGGGRAMLAAHDWGGAVAWNVALAHPGKLHRLVIANAPHPWMFWHALVNDPVQREASEYMNWLRRPGSEAVLAADGFGKLESFMHGPTLPTWFDAATRAAYHAAWGQPGALAGGINYYRASPLHPATDTEPGAAGLSLDPALSVVRVPTLMLWGERDTALRPVLVDGIERFVPQLTQHRYADGTHWILHEHPADIAARMDAFMGAALSA